MSDDRYEEREAPPWQQVPPVRNDVETAERQPVENFEELAPVEPPAIHPITGEVLALDAPTEELARALDEIRDYESRLREAKAIVSREVLARLDASAQWTVRVGDYTLKAPSPAPGEVWDELALRSDLYDLVDQGVITEEAAAAAVETIVDYKVRKVGVNALRKLGGVVAETVDRHCQPVEKTRYISVTRS